MRQEWNAGVEISPQQKHVWTLSQREDAFPYIAQCTLDITGPLAPERLKQTVETLVSRYDTLHTAFLCSTDTDYPLQAVAEARVCWHEDCDLSHVRPDEQLDCLDALLLALRNLPFELSSGELLHCQLVRCSAHRHALLMHIPALVADHATYLSLSHEMERYYNGAGPARSDDPEALQYSDLAAWQNEILEAEDGETGRQFWRKRCSMLPASDAYTLPFACLPTGQLPFDPRAVYTSIDRDLLQDIEAFCREQAISCSSFFVACWFILLQRLTTQKDIVVGVACDGRKYEELRDQPGLLTKYLPLLLSLGESPSFPSFVSQVEQAVGELYTWQEYFAWEQDSSEKGHQHSTFSFDFGEASAQHAATSFSIQRMNCYIDRFTVKLSCLRGLSGLTLALHYDASLLTREAIECMADELQTLLCSALAAPLAPVNTLSILSDKATARLLKDFNTIPACQSPYMLLHQLFEDQVACRPDSVAIVLEDQQVTYRQLNQQANRLATRLRSLGVGAHILVGLYLERSVELVVGMLAVLKAGGAYVPLDPRSPEERLAFLVEDAGMHVLLTQASLAGSLPACSARTLLLDEPQEIRTDQDDANPTLALSQESPAYVIYTSGSTGKPKGTLVTHHNITRLFQCSEPLFRFNAQDHWSLFHSPAFDFSVWEIWGALLYGGRLVIVPYMVSRSPDLFCQLLNREAITVLNQTPSAFSQVQPLMLTGRAADPVNTTHLRLVIFGGEALDTRSLGPWLDQQRDQPPQFMNMYGITETTVHVTYHQVQQADLQFSKTSLIGKPLPDLQVYLLDRQMQLVPIGMVGEMYVGGCGLAQGYLHRPDLTAERFVPHPFSQQEGARLYRSGDLARYLPSGDLEYLGRADQQVKLRGFRIELEEIEAILDAHQAVKKAIVSILDEKTDMARLVAYIIPQAQYTLDTAELSDYVSRALPEYMRPATYCELADIPLTSNGKIDRRNLPTPTGNSLTRQQTIVPPRTSTEDILVALCRELLSLPEVSTHDNFFSIGGHSILAVQLISRIRSIFNVEIPIRELFEHQSVCMLARLIDAELQQVPQASQQVACLVERQRERECVPLSFGQERLWFLHQLDPGSSRYHIPLALRLQGKLALAAFQQALSALIGRHEILHTHFPVVDGQPKQSLSRVETLPLAFFDLSGLPKEEQEIEVEQLVRHWIEAPFNLEEGPLLRMGLARLYDEEHVLCLVMHHIISDGWSLGILLEEFSLLYQAFMTNQPSPLPPLKMQYADYACWQREWLSGERLTNQLNYWRDHLARSPDLLALPTDHPRPRVLSSQGASVPVHVPAPLCAALHQLAQHSQVTLFMTLLASFATLLARYSNQHDLVIGTPIANRRLAESEALIGFLVNTLPLRLDLRGDPSFEELLRRVREVTLQGYAQQDVPFELMVEALRPRRSLSHAPLFQVLFVMQNTPLPPLHFPHLTTQELAPDWSATQFDLTLTLAEEDNALEARFEYSTDLFEAQTIQRLAEHWLTLLAGIVHTPTCSLSALPLLSAAQRAHVLHISAASDSPIPAPYYVHQVIEQQVERSPDAIALVCGSTTLSYAALNSIANQFARVLHERGVGPEQRVGVCLPRGCELIIALLGILKAGGAYVPLDPTYPADRLSFMIEDARATLLLTTRELRARLPSFLPPSTVLTCLEEIWPLLPLHSSLPLQTMLDPENLAYCIYTSGSTGKPKGTLVEHRGLCNMMEAQVQTFQTTPTDHVLQFSSFSFDASIFEILMALRAGATLSMIHGEKVPLGDDLLRFLQEQLITQVTLPPSTLATLPALALPHLQTIIVAGEACSRDLIQQWAPTRRFFNAYGLTETSIWATGGFCHAESLSSPSIGRPLANIELYILDQQLQLMPMGAVGEIYIGGACLSRGYLERPDITAERFVPHPFSCRPGARLYRTGDLARYRADTEIEYVGRSDLQVKLRGFRIEAGEIEAALNQHPQIQQSVVNLYEFTPEDRRLIAYVVASQGATVDAGQLRSFLQEHLPTHMLPSAFVELAAFPLAPGGKVDRKALMPPDSVKRGSQAAYVAPQNEEERAVAAIWQELLGIDKIGLHDNFFDVGGHSLLVVQLQERLRQRLQATLTLTDLFEHSTIAAQAAYLTRDGKETFSFVQPVARAERKNRALQSRKEARQQLKL